MIASATVRLGANVLLAALAGAFVLVFGQWIGNALELVLVPAGARPIFFALLLLGFVGVAGTIAILLHGEGYVATLVLTAPLVPSLAAALTVVFNASGAPAALREQSLLAAVWAAGAMWVFSGLFLRWMARADTAQPRSAGELEMRTRSIRARLEAIAPEGFEDLDVARRSLISQVRVQLALLERELGMTGSGTPTAGLRYAQASGYVNLWRFLHRGEEALMGLEPLSSALAAARTDRLRVSKSSIPNRAELLVDLKAALDVLEPPLVPVGAPAAGLSPSTAAGVLTEIRRAINVSRDDGWEGLIRERNRLLRTVLLSSTVTFLFVALSMSLGAPPTALGVGAVFFLVGSGVGLIAMLRAERRSGRAVDDYGLFEARLVATPLLSGLTGLAGVLLLAIAPAALGTDALGDQANNVKLGDIFSLDKNGRGLLAAAVFGLAPELLISWLSRDSDRLKRSLTSTEPTGAAGSPGED